MLGHAWESPRSCSVMPGSVLGSVRSCPGVCSGVSGHAWETARLRSVMPGRGLGDALLGDARDGRAGSAG